MRYKNRFVSSFEANERNRPLSCGKRAKEWTLRGPKGNLNMPKLTILPDGKVIEVSKGKKDFSSIEFKEKVASLLK